MELKVWKETKEVHEQIKTFHFVQTETHIYRISEITKPIEPDAFTVEYPDMYGKFFVTVNKLKNGKAFGRGFMVNGPIPHSCGVTAGVWPSVEAFIEDVKSGKKLERLK